MAAVLSIPVVEKVSLTGPIDLSIIERILDSGDASEFSDLDYAKLHATMVALNTRVDRATAAEKKRGRCFMFCERCLEVEILECPDQLPPHWHARVFMSKKPHTTYVHSICGCESNRCD